MHHRSIHVLHQHFTRLFILVMASLEEGKVDTATESFAIKFIQFLLRLSQGQKNFLSCHKSRYKVSCSWRVASALVCMISRQEEEGCAGPQGSHPTVFFCFFMVFFQKGGGLGRSKSFESLFFALKQSKANKCQCAKRLKTVKKLFLKFFVKDFWKK